MTIPSSLSRSRVATSVSEWKRIHSLELLALVIRPLARAPFPI